jgi:hypothetical protein
MVCLNFTIRFFWVHKIFFTMFVKKESPCSQCVSFCSFVLDRIHSISFNAYILRILTCQHSLFCLLCSKEANDIRWCLQRNICLGTIEDWLWRLAMDTFTHLYSLVAPCTCSPNILAMLELPAEEINLRTYRLLPILAMLELCSLLQSQFFFFHHRSPNGVGLNSCLFVWYWKISPIRGKVFIILVVVKSDAAWLSSWPAILVSLPVCLCRALCIGFARLSQENHVSNLSTQVLLWSVYQFFRSRCISALLTYMHGNKLKNRSSQNVQSSHMYLFVAVGRNIICLVPQFSLTSE